MKKNGWILILSIATACGNERSVTPPAPQNTHDAASAAATVAQPAGALVATFATDWSGWVVSSDGKTLGIREGSNLDLFSSTSGEQVGAWPLASAFTGVLALSTDNVLSDLFACAAATRLPMATFTLTDSDGEANGEYTAFGNFIGPLVLDGGASVIVSAQTQLRKWTLGDGTAQQAWGISSSPFAMALSGDATVLALLEEKSDGSGQLVTMVDPATGVTLPGQLLFPDDGFDDIIFAGTTLLIHHGAQLLAYAPDLSEISELELPASAQVLAAKGKQAVVLTDGTTLLIDWKTGKTLFDFSEQAQAATFTAHGIALLTAGNDYAVQLWTLH